MTGLAIPDEGLQAKHLCTVDVYLAVCHISQFHIIEYLYVGLRHLHLDVVLRLLQVLRGSLQVQLVELDLVGNLETSEQRYGST